MKDEPTLMMWITQYLCVPAANYIRYHRSDTLSHVKSIAPVRTVLVVWRERI